MLESPSVAQRIVAVMGQEYLDELYVQYGIFTKDKIREMRGELSRVLIEATAAASEAAAADVEDPQQQRQRQQKYQKHQKQKQQDVARST
jgi:hypothetical protein